MGAFQTFLSRYQMSTFAYAHMYAYMRARTHGHTDFCTQEPRMTLLRRALFVACLCTHAHKHTHT